MIRETLAVSCFKRFMSSKSILLAAFAVLLLSFAIPGTVKADTLPTVYVDGSVAFWDGNIGIPPYGGTLNGQSESFYCVDFSHDIQAGDSWLSTELPKIFASNAYQSGGTVVVVTFDPVVVVVTLSVVVVLV